MATAVGFPAKDLKEKDPGSWKPLATATRCSRCDGLMVIEQRGDFPVRRCVQCGDITDEVILRNRHAHLVEDQDVVRAA